MKTIFATLFVLTILYANPAAHAQQPSVFMQVKKANTQKIFESMLHADYEGIRKNAQSMKNAGVLEKFVRSNIPGYREQLTNFEEANAGLIQAANDKNLDDAMVSYAALTMSCVMCHKAMRNLP